MPRPLPLRAAALAVLGATLVACGDGEPTKRDLDVTWGESESAPACTYTAGSTEATARIVVDGVAPPSTRVTVTVTAYADENTSQLVGTGTRTVEVGGTVHRDLRITIPVDAPPHVGEDDVAACRLAVTYPPA